MADPSARHNATETRNLNKETIMTIANSNPAFGTRVKEFILALDATPGDYLFDNAEYARQKLRELEARITRLENQGIELAEVPQQSSVV